MAEKELEKEVRERKIAPVVDEAMHKVLGVSIDELTKDISEKLSASPLLDIHIDTSMGFKEAKKRFKEDFLKKLLRISYGNITEVAKRAGVDRRSIHRIVKDAGINVDKIREEMVKPYEVRHKAVGHIIEDVLERYKGIIHPDKMQDVYLKVPEVSKDIMDEIDFRDISLDEAEEAFEKAFVEQSLKENKGNLAKTAKAIGIRYETLLRKIKDLGLR